MVSGSLLHLDLVFSCRNFIFRFDEIIFHKFNLAIPSSKFQQFHELDFTLLSISALFWSSFFILLLYCVFGKVASSSYENISIYLYEANWVELPLELQKYFVVLIANAQRPLFYHGFGVVVLHLETFTKVRKPKK